MAELLILSKNNKVIRTEGDGFAWGSMESKAVFDIKYPYEEFHGKLSLIKCPGMSRAEAQTLEGGVFSSQWLDPDNQTELSRQFETTLSNWALFMSVSNG